VGQGSELTRCPAGDPDAPKVLLAWGTAGNRTWAVMAKPPRPGERLVCWAVGDHQPNGSTGVGTSRIAVRPLRLSGDTWPPGRVMGIVTARADRVRVLFDPGVAPLDLVPIQATSRSPVKFFAGAVASPVVRLVAYDQAGRKVAECWSRPGSAGDRCG
jgi:hypothetical protein